MEGVLDSLVRELLTEVNDYDLCITEFLRVVDQLLPVKVFHRLCPELLNGSRREDIAQGEAAVRAAEAQATAQAATLDKLAVRAPRAGRSSPSWC